MSSMIEKRSLHCEPTEVENRDDNNIKIKIYLTLNYEVENVHGKHERPSYPKFPVVTFRWEDSSRTAAQKNPRLVSMDSYKLEKLIIEKFKSMFACFPLKITLVRKWGCSCGCSPAWRIRGLPAEYDRKIIRVTFSVSQA